MSRQKLFYQIVQLYFFVILSYGVNCSVCLCFGFCLFVLCVFISLVCFFLNLLRLFDWFGLFIFLA